MNAPTFRKAANVAGIQVSLFPRELWGNPIRFAPRYSQFPRERIGAAAKNWAFRRRSPEVANFHGLLGEPDIFG